MAARRPKSTPPPTPTARRPRHALFIAALWALALTAYSNSFSAGLVFDSQRVILADSRIQADTPDNVHQIWTGDYYNGTGSSALYRPLTTLTYLWNYAILGNGPNAAGYHWVNFLIHGLNITLVYLLGLILLQEVWPAFALAGLWAVHPVLTESVTNVVGRADLLAAFGILAGLLCYAHSASSTGWRRIAWIAALAASAAIAIFSKESGVVLLAVLVVYDLAFVETQRRVDPLVRSGRPRPDLPTLLDISQEGVRPTSWRDRALRYLAVLAPLVLYFLMRRTALAQVSSQLIAFTDNPLLGANFLASRLTALKVAAEYLLLLLFPARLSPDYSYSQIPVNVGIGAILSVILWIAVAVAAVVSFRRARPVFFGIAFFLVTIAPVANIAILVGSIMAERFLYLPSIGFLGSVVWLAYRRVPARWHAAALAIVALAFAVRTYARNLDWHDERSLWANAVQVSPDSYKTHHNMALMILADPKPNFAAATREVERALAILDSLPDSENIPLVYATAGRCYRAVGNLPKALAVLQRGRSIDHAWNDAFLAANHREAKNVGSVGTPNLYLDLGRVYRDLGQPGQALEALRSGRSIDPQPAFFEELARTYTAVGQSEQAATSLLEGLAIDGSQSNLASELVQLYQATAPQSCALNRTAANASLNLNCPMVHAQLCAASQNVFTMFNAMRDAVSAGTVAQNAVRNFACPADLFR